MASSTPPINVSRGPRPCSQSCRLPSTCSSIPSFGKRFLRLYLLEARRRLGLRMPAPSRILLTVDRDSSIPSRSLSNSVMWVWFIPEYTPSANSLTISLVSASVVQRGFLPLFP